MPLTPALRVAYFLAPLACLLSGLLSSASAAEPTPSPTRPQVVLLKFDDVTTNGAHGTAPISPRWQKLADYLTAQHLKGSFGIICHSLEKDSPAYFKWIKDLQAAGLIEFWLHGYHERTDADKVGEFEVGTAAEQQAIFEKSEALALAKLGFSLPAFGPHWSATTDATDEALAAVPAVKIWLYGPKQPKFYRGLSIERLMALENPTFVPDPKKFQETYLRSATKTPVLVLQGHPNAWTDERWAGFLQIIEFLRTQHVVFQTPSEYLASLSATPRRVGLPEGHVRLGDGTVGLFSASGQIALHDGAQPLLRRQVINLIQSSNFHSGPGDKFHIFTAEGVERDYRDAVAGGEYIVLLLSPAQKFDTTGGEITAAEILVNLHGPGAQNCVFTIDDAGTVVSHAKYAGEIFLELKKMVAEARE